ncbi:thioredoxin [Candidatus Peregrinibacteria bacterium]|nr:thioredoxin [Candidatus Peregrinibacteria bacterium]
MSEVTFTDSNFNDEVLQSDMPVLVDFFAPWCGPCKMMGPVIEKLAGEYKGKVKIGKLDVDENPEIAGQHGIQSIPTLIIFKGGEMADKLVGFQSEEQLKAKLDEL